MFLGSREQLRQRCVKVSLWLIYVSEAKLFSGGLHRKLFSDHTDTMLKHSAFHVSQTNCHTSACRTRKVEGLYLSSLFHSGTPTNNNKQRKTLPGMMGKTERLQELKYSCSTFLKLYFWLLLGPQLLYFIVCFLSENIIKFPQFKIIN